MPVKLVFRGLRDHPLGELENVDADALADNLLVPPWSVAGQLLASTIHTAARMSKENETTEDVVIDRGQLEAIHQACSDSLEMQQVPSLRQLCAAVAQAVASP